MKKGFTLIELLAVIVLLGVISLITFPIVSKSILNSRERAYDIQVDVIEEAARSWSIDNSSSLSEIETVSVSLSDLIGEGYITKTDDGVIHNPINDNVMDGCVLIEYSSEYEQYIFTYDEDCTP